MLSISNSPWPFSLRLNDKWVWPYSGSRQWGPCKGNPNSLWISHRLIGGKSKEKTLGGPTNGTYTRYTWYDILYIYMSPKCMLYSKQQNHLHVWKFWIVYLIGNLISFLKSLEYYGICSMISAIFLKKNIANQCETSRNITILYSRSHSKSFVADKSKAENCILSVFSMATFGF